MPAFRFRLDSVLKLRESDRQQRRAELAQALEAERILLLQAEELANELGIIKQSYRDASSAGEIDVDRLLDVQRYVLYMTAQAQIVRQRQTNLREEIERRRAVLTEADRQVRLLEKLRDRQRQVFDHQQRQLEQKDLDEVGARGARPRRD